MYIHGDMDLANYYIATYILENLLSLTAAVRNIVQVLEQLLLSVFVTVGYGDGKWGTREVLSSGP